MSSNKPRLQDLATCSVCLELLNEPKMLPCQHTFCQSCIQKGNWHSTSKDSPSKLKCPQCRAETLLPKGGVAALPGNIYLQSLLDFIQQDEKESRCLTCNTACDVTECQHCAYSFCTICEQRHLTELHSQLQCILEQLEAAKGRMTCRIKSFLVSCDKVKECIHLEIQRRVQAILQEESQLVNQVDEISKQERATCTEILHRLEVNALVVSELLKGEFARTPTSQEKVAKFLNVHRDSSDCLAAADGTTFESIEFAPEFLTVTGYQSTSPLPADTIQVTTAENVAVEETTTSTTGDCQKVQRSNSKKLIQDSDDAHSLYYRSRSFVAKARIGSSFLQRPAGVAISPWSKEIYVVSMDTHRVYVFELPRGKFLRSFGSRGKKQGEFLCPYGIALVAESQEIIVSDKWKHCLHVFGRNEKFLRQIGTKGSGAGQFRSPESICVDQKGQIYVCDTINNRIQVLNKDGTYLRDIDGQVPIATDRGMSIGGTRQRTLFQEPAGIAVSRDGNRLVVCDFINHRIHVFSQEGTPLLTCGQKGSLRGQFNNPECVSLDNQGFIFVGDSGNGRIQILRPDGRFVRTFGVKGTAPGQFNWISGIAVSDSHDVVVCDYKNHCLQIF